MREDNYIGGILDRETHASLGLYWKDQRLEYSGSDPIYKGVHYIHNASIDDTEWEIWKFSYDTGNLVRIEGPLRGAWSNRTGLDWG